MASDMPRLHHFGKERHSVLDSYSTYHLLSPDLRPESLYFSHNYLLGIYFIPGKLLCPSTELGIRQ